MEISTYAVEADVERTHWWFAGRRKMLRRLISELGLASDSRILDVGTSTGYGGAIILNGLTAGQVAQRRPKPHLAINPKARILEEPQERGRCEQAPVRQIQNAAPPVVEPTDEQRQPHW